MFLYVIDSYFFGYSWRSIPYIVVLLMLTFKAPPPVNQFYLLSCHYKVILSVFTWQDSDFNKMTWTCEILCLVPSKQWCFWLNEQFCHQPKMLENSWWRRQKCPQNYSLGGKRQQNLVNVNSRKTWWIISQLIFKIIQNDIVIVAFLHTKIRQMK